MKKTRIRVPAPTREGVCYCPDCKEEKPETDFQKCSGRKNGLQLYCRACQNSRTTNYREVTEGAYWKHQPNTPYYIYSITSPDNKVYVGWTATKPNLRWRRHIAMYRHRKVTLALLFESFDKFGVDNHIFQVVDQVATKEQAQLRESELILRYKETNNSLNVFMSAFRLGMYDKKTGELIKIWNSITEAAIALNGDKIIKKGSIYYYHTYIRSAVMKANRSGRTLGYLWKILPFENGYFYDPKKQAVEEFK